MKHAQVHEVDILRHLMVAIGSELPSFRTDPTEEGLFEASTVISIPKNNANIKSGDFAFRSSCNMPDETTVMNTAARTAIMFLEKTLHFETVDLHHHKLNIAAADLNYLESLHHQARTLGNYATSLCDMTLGNMIVSVEGGVLLALDIVKALGSAESTLSILKCFKQFSTAKKNCDNICLPAFSHLNAAS